MEKTYFLCDLTKREFVCIAQKGQRTKILGRGNTPYECGAKTAVNKLKVEEITTIPFSTRYAPTLADEYRHFKQGYYAGRRS